jgi:hypothetical protein
MKRLLPRFALISALAALLLTGCKDFWHPEGPESNNHGYEDPGYNDPGNNSGGNNNSNGNNNSGGGSGSTGTIRVMNVSSYYSGSLSTGSVIISNSSTGSSIMNETYIYDGSYRDFTLPVGYYSVRVNNAESSIFYLESGVTKIVRYTRSSSSMDAIEVVGN